VRGVEHIPWLYDATMWLFEQSGLLAWRDWLVRGARGRVLEVGCGTGRNLPRYPAAVRVIGVEPDLAALERARRRAPTVPLVRARAEQLPFRDGCFDTVVSSLVFCSVDHPAAGLAEIRRLLAPTGELRMLEHVRAKSRLGGFLQDRLQPIWTWASGGCRPNRPTEQSAEAAGFTIDAASYRARRLLRRFVARPRPASRRPDLAAPDRTL
jgi:ubiquinone/menaquinone biosynthesis C-methylase UbiE